jgi:hypothetical protein
VNVALPLLVESTADAKIKVKEKENNNKKVWNTAEWKIHSFYISHVVTRQPTHGKKRERDKGKKVGKQDFSHNR